MVVGTCRIELEFPGNDSLKGKRRVVRSLIERMRNRFNVAAAEVGALEDRNRATLGVACVSNDSIYVDGLLRRIIGWLEDDGRASLRDYRIEISREWYT